MPISVMILTLNEEINIVACIETVKIFDDIVVLDSFSSDRTVDIARSLGVRVIQRKFDNWSSHQNWAMEYIIFKNKWVLYLDADERCTPELLTEIQEIVKFTRNEVAYRVRRKDFFHNKWLKHAQLYPTWLVRLFQPQKIRFERLVNPVPVVDGVTGELSAHIHHYPFSHGIAHWVERHNKYSDMEALEALKEKRKSVEYLKLFYSNPNMRRKVLKSFFYKLPARPFIKFIYYYFIRCGFLDGAVGFKYSVLQSFYEYMIVLKTEEIYRKGKGESL